MSMMWGHLPADRTAGASRPYPRIVGLTFVTLSSIAIWGLVLWSVLR